MKGWFVTANVNCSTYATNSKSNAKKLVAMLMNSIAKPTN